LHKCAHTINQTRARGTRWGSSTLVLLALIALLACFYWMERPEVRFSAQELQSDSWDWPRWPASHVEGRRLAARNKMHRARMDAKVREQMRAPPKKAGVEGATKNNGAHAQRKWEPHPPRPPVGDYPFHTTRWAGSGDHPLGFSLLCDWIVARLVVYGDKNKPPRTVYVKTDYLLAFELQVLPLIKSPFVLISGSADRVISGRNNAKSDWDWRRLIENEFLVAWFAENADVRHPKMHPFPLGLLWDKQLPGGSQAEAVERFYASQPPDLKASMAVGRWRERKGEEYSDRKDARVLCQKSKWCHWLAQPVPQNRLWGLYGEDAFVVSPHGGGIDPCPRVWEALLLGAIPIVKSSPLDAAFTHLPVVVVQKWNDITLSNMEMWKQELSPRFENKSTLLHSLSSQYWMEIIDSLISTKYVEDTILL